MDFKTVASRAIARTLMGGGCIHVFMFCPMSFFSKLTYIDLKRNLLGKISIYEYTPLLPPTHVLATAQVAHSDILEGKWAT